MHETPKVLILATSPMTRGGITSVIKAYQLCDVWKDFHCRWIETHRDGSAFVKLVYFIYALFQYVLLLPYYDIVHIHVSEPPSALRKCFFMPLAKFLRKKTILHFHSFSPDTTVKSNKAYLYSYLFGKADIVIALSPYWKREIYSALPQIKCEKIHVLYNPCTCEMYPETYRKKNSILFAGAIVARKGYEDLLRAYAQVVKMHPDWDLVIAGDGELNKAKAIVKELNIIDKVKFLGWIRGQDKDRAFKEASIFCLPSYAEGFPMAVLDAWAYGLPVVATPVGGLLDIAKENTNIMLFPVGEVRTLCDKLCQIIEKKEFRRKMGEEGLKLADTTFNQYTIANQLAQLYTLLADPKKKDNSIIS